MYKLLIFHHYNSPLGAGLSLLHILQEINRNQIDVTVCLPNIEGHLDCKIKEVGIRVIYSDSITAYMHFSGGQTVFVSKRHLQNLHNVYKSRANISEIIRGEEPDIVAVNSMTLFWIGRIAKAMNKRTVCFHRETYCRGLFGIRTSVMKKELSNCFDMVTFLSDYDLQQTPQGTARFVKITDKVDVETYEKLDMHQCRTKLGLPQNSRLVLYVGGIAKLKGPMNIIRAMNLIQMPDVKLVFLQYQDPDIKTLRDKIKYNLKRLLRRNLQYDIAHYVRQNKMQDKIIFRPATDQVELFFGACDIVVFPSHAPHQARPVYEAGIARKPIIITDFPNTREFVDNNCGWTFPKDDFRALAKCIEEALDVSAHVRVKENYRRTMQKNNLNTLPEELYGLFEDLMENGNDE